MWQSLCNSLSVYPTKVAFEDKMRKDPRLCSAEVPEKSQVTKQLNKSKLYNVKKIVLTCLFTVFLNYSTTLVVSVCKAIYTYA